MGKDDDIHDTKSKRYKAMLARHAEYTKQLKAAKDNKPSKAKAKKRKPVAKKTNKSKAGRRLTHTKKRK